MFEVSFKAKVILQPKVSQIGFFSTLMYQKAFSGSLNAHIRLVFRLYHTNSLDIIICI